MAIVILDGNKIILVELYIMKRITIIGVKIEGQDSVNVNTKAKNGGRQFLKGSTFKQI